MDLAIAFLRRMEIRDRYEYIFGIIFIPVTNDVEFEFDGPKSQYNLAKHGINFLDAQ
ncbi:MAG: hypothetical protein HC770_13230 [Pseudanabaena sp. CRU_2_10]|nr:hypothetical protein [Pseudanabaena sp. CRU_2_10]